MKKKILLAGSITVFVLLMLGMILGLYLMGFKSAFLNELETEELDLLNDENQQPAEQTKSLLDSITGAVISAFTEHLDILLPMLGFGLLAGFTGGSYAGGSIIKYIIMIMLVFVVINIFFFPVIPSVAKGIEHSGFNPLITILSIIFNAMLFLTVFTFVSGED